MAESFGVLRLLCWVPNSHRRENGNAALPAAGASGSAALLAIPAETERWRARFVAGTQKLPLALDVSPIKTSLPVCAAHRLTLCQSQGGCCPSLTRARLDAPGLALLCCSSSVLLTELRVTPANFCSPSWLQSKQEFFPCLGLHPQNPYEALAPEPGAGKQRHVLQGCEGRGGRCQPRSRLSSCLLSPQPLECHLNYFSS